MKLWFGKPKPRSPAALTQAQARVHRRPAGGVSGEETLADRIAAHRQRAAKQTAPSPLSVPRAASTKRRRSSAELGTFLSFHKRIVTASVALVMAVALAFLGWRILGDTIAHASASANPDLALNWDPHNAVALDHLAAQVVTRTAQRARANSFPPTIKENTFRDDVESVRRLTARSLRAEPLDADAVANLAAIENIGGDQSRFHALTAVAVQRTKRNLLAQTLALQADLAHGDVSKALSHIDVMMRVAPATGDILFPSLDRFVSTPDGRNQLVPFIRTSPWRVNYLSYLASRSTEPALAAEFVSRLLDAGSSLTATEVKPVILKLIDKGHFEQAYALREKIAPVSIVKKDLLNNGAFERSPDGLPFDWVLSSGLDAKARVVSSGKPDGAYLEVEFSGARVQQDEVATQLLLLKPGSYKFSVDAMASDFKARRGIWWQISCLGGGKPIAHSELIVKSVRWHKAQFDFSVPATGCAAQSLELAIPSRVDLERQLEGEVRFRQAQIRTSS